MFISFFLFARSEMSSKTVKLTSLCGDWEAKVEDESIPEESERDCFTTDQCDYSQTRTGGALPFRENVLFFD